MIRNLLLLLGTYHAALLALPLVGALLPFPAVSTGGEAVIRGAILAAVKYLVVFAAAGALLCAVVESTRRLRWAVALALVPLALYLYTVARHGSGGVNAAFVTIVLISNHVSALLGASIGYLIDRRRRGKPTP
jgi:hypothetical protein